MDNESKFRILQHLNSISKSCDKLKDHVLNPLVVWELKNDFDFQQICKHVDAIKDLKEKK